MNVSTVTAFFIFFKENTWLGTHSSDRDVSRTVWTLKPTVVQRVALRWIAFACTL